MDVMPYMLALFGVRRATDRFAKGAKDMKNLIIGASVTMLLVVLLVCAFAFSASLQNLHIGAKSFALPAAPALAAPMTFNDESQLGTAQPATVHFQIVQPTEHVCQRDQAQDSTAGF
jgi:hypothetical protein